MKILAFDLGGSAIKYALIEDDGLIVDIGSSKNLNNEVFEIYAESIDKIINQYSNISCLSFSTPGGYYNGVISGSSKLMCIHGFNIKEYFQTKYQLPCFFINDGNACALGEFRMGAGFGYLNIASLVIGSGIGGGVVIDGKLIVGKEGFGGEFGHGLYKSDFSTGSFSNFHDYGSVGGVIERYCKLKGLTVDFSIGKMIFDLADEGSDEAAIRVCSEFYDSLATLILTVNYACDFEVIVLSGLITQRGNFLSSLEERFKRVEETKKTKIKLNVKLSKYPDRANLYGAWYYGYKMLGK